MDTSNIININGKEYDMSAPSSVEYAKKYIESFGDEYKNQTTSNIDVTLNSNNVDGYYIELNTNLKNTFDVEIFDENDNSIYKTKLSNGMYSKLSRKYYTKWKTKLNLQSLSFEHVFDLENSRVFIVFESSSLGILLRGYLIVMNLEKNITVMLLFLHL